jgi:hypothetical protein
MSKFLIASLYVDRDIDLMGSHVSALTPFDALIKDCTSACDVADWEACQIVETEVWNAIVWRVDKGKAPVLVPYTDMGFPWSRINELTARIGALRDAVDLAGKLEILSEIPGTNADAIDLEPVRTELVELEKQRAKISDAWEKRKAKPLEDARQLRSVQVDPPEGGDDVVPF